MSVLHERARVASLSRSRTQDDPELVSAKRNLAAERLAAYIRTTVNGAPPLTEAQRSALAAMLRPHPMAGGGDHDHAA